MEVSTFELLYKPLTPALEPGTDAIARRVLQGYFLTIANLEDVPFRFRIEFNITLPSPDDPARRLDDNALFITDIAAPGNTFSTSLTRSPAGGNRYLRTFNVPAKTTALVVLLPNITVPGFFTTSTTPNIEIRGHVGLSLPCVFTAGPVTAGGLPSFTFGPQAGAPARVLLTAEHRSTYLPAGWPGNSIGDLDFDQTGVSLPLATGRALNEIPQVTPCRFIIGRLPLPTLRLAEFLVEQQDALEAIDPVTAIIGGLARLDPSPDNLERLDAMIGELDLPLRVQGRATKD